MLVEDQLPSAPAEVKFDDGSFRYHKRRVLESISFEVRGGWWGISGNNGSGKSTLMRLVATVARPSSGDVYIDGLNCSGRSERQSARTRLSYLPQVTRHDSGLTAKNWLEYGCWLQRIPAGQIAAVVDAAIEEWRIASLTDIAMKRLSVGQRRRVDLARACMVPGTRLLVLDEPFAALDAEAAHLAVEILRNRALATTVVISDPVLSSGEIPILVSLPS